LKEAKTENSPTPFAFCLIFGQHSLQILAKNFKNSPETHSKGVLHSLKFLYLEYGGKDT